MTSFTLDPRLAADGLPICRLDLSHLLLLNNAAVPWFILVPETASTELFELNALEQQRLLAEINLVSRFLRKDSRIEKLNVAAIGNIVRQLHVHVIGRHSRDYCWPEPVWGRPSGLTYSDEDADFIKRQFTSYLCACLREGNPFPGR